MTGDVSFKEIARYEPTDRVSAGSTQRLFLVFLAGNFSCNCTAACMTGRPLAPGVVCDCCCSTAPCSPRHHSCVHCATGPPRSHLSLPGGLGGSSSHRTSSQHINRVSGVQHMAILLVHIPEGRLGLRLSLQAAATMCRLQADALGRDDTVDLLAVLRLQYV